MKIKTKGFLSFKGGVHPPDGKELTENLSVKIGPTANQLSILMSQHIGAICKPTVSKGQEVKAGDVIGDSEAFVSAKIHSPVDGIVKDITLKSHPVLGRETAVVIETSQSNEPKQPCFEKFVCDFDISQYSQSQIIEAVTNAGIVGMGGAGFPTNVKIAPNPKMPKHTMIVNACECEPYITCDYRLMMEWAEQFIAGVRLLRKAAGCEKAYIGIEDNKPDAIKVITQAVSKCPAEENIKVVPLKTKYPQGGERQLINAVMRKVVPTGTIPPMIGMLVCNVATCAAASEAVILGNPLTHRIVTVTGRGIRNPGNFYTPVGTPVSELIEFCGGLTDDAVKVIMGGPMMGFSIADLSMPTTKTTGSILVLTKKEVGKAKFLKQQTACVRCGRCVDVCPEGLNPSKIAHAVKAGRLDLAQKYNIEACIECGCCSYVCPGKLEIAGYIKTGKILLARMKKRMPK